MTYRQLREQQRAERRRYLEQLVEGRTIVEAAKLADLHRGSFHKMLRDYGIVTGRIHRGWMYRSVTLSERLHS